MVHARQLLERAQGGDKISTKERRYVIEFLLATEPDVTNTQMAQWFGVSERMIRIDRQVIREEKAKFLREEMGRDASLVIADIAMDYEHQVRDIEKSKQKAPLGSRRFLDHCVAIMDLRLRMTRAFQDIGYLPKNLGNMTVDKYVYKSIVSKDGSVEVRAVNAFDEDVIEGEVTDIQALPPVPNASDETSEQFSASGDDHPEHGADQAGQLDPAPGPS